MPRSRVLSKCLCVITFKELCHFDLHELLKLIVITIDWYKNKSVVIRLSQFVFWQTLVLWVFANAYCVITNQNSLSTCFPIPFHAMGLIRLKQFIKFLRLYKYVRKINIMCKMQSTHQFVAYLWKYFISH